MRYSHYASANSGAGIINPEYLPRQQHAASVFFVA